MAPSAAFLARACGLRGDGAAGAPTSWLPRRLLCLRELRADSVLGGSGGGGRGVELGVLLVTMKGVKSTPLAAHWLLQVLQLMGFNVLCVVADSGRSPDAPGGCICESDGVSAWPASRPALALDLTTACKASLPSQGAAQLVGAESLRDLLPRSVVSRGAIEAGVLACAPCSADGGMFVVGVELSEPERTSSAIKI